jgi:hypothetical protein
MEGYICMKNIADKALPSRRYRELLGSALCAFNNNNFMIENNLNNDNNYTWLNLIDMESGQLFKPIKETISKASDTNIASLFEEIVTKRNRIIHSFQITDKDGEQRLATKDKKHKQYVITEDYLQVSYNLFQFTAVG